MLYRSYKQVLHLFAVRNCFSLSDSDSYSAALLVTVSPQAHYFQQ